MSILPAAPLWPRTSMLSNMTVAFPEVMSDPPLFTKIAPEPDTVVFPETVLFPASVAPLSVGLVCATTNPAPVTFDPPMVVELAQIATCPVVPLPLTVPVPLLLKVFQSVVSKYPLVVVLAFGIPRFSGPSVPPPVNGGVVTMMGFPLNPANVVETTLSVTLLPSVAEPEPVALPDSVMAGAGRLVMPENGIDVAFPPVAMMLPVPVAVIEFPDPTTTGPLLIWFVPLAF